MKREDSKIYNLDYILNEIGQFGPYQRRIVFLISFVAISTAFNNLNYVFLAYRLDHECIISNDLQKNISHFSNNSLFNESFLNLLDIKNESNFIGSDSCYLYTSNNLKYKNCSSKECSEQIIECEKWNYDTREIKSSIVSEFDLVCSMSWLVSLTQSMYMVGRIVGCIIYGHLSDRFGRRISLFIAIFSQLVFSITSSWINNIYLFLIFRFFLGIQTTGEFQIAFVIALENVGPSYRTLTGIIMHMYWAVGYMSLAGLAYIFRERFTLQLVTTVPLCFLLILLLFIPETPRFLLSSNQREKCITMLKTMSKTNGNKLPGALESKLQEEQVTKNYTAFDLLKYKHILRTTIILMVAWFANSFIYYGLSLNTGLFAGNIYLNFFLSGLIEVPSYFLGFILLTKLGRPLPLSLTLLSAGLALLLSVLVPTEVSPYLSMTGKGCITCSFIMIYIYSAELYPTRLRSIGLGICALMARVAAVLSPFVTDVTYIWKHLPIVLYCSVALIAGILVILLPETKNRPFPQTVEEGEFINSHSFIFGYFKPRKLNTKEFNTKELQILNETS